eukprot:TRINITY_DN582_c1_g1_i1.p1 TRINITY_DN582_c1_g1~~TRINITY_DN582_c1_g1_i1.p1  ORF type:complete len:304 (+),score=39.37 TRINITY_DN582_c1_g1_i1:412-1323(+)
MSVHCVGSGGLPSCMQTGINFHFSNSVDTQTETCVQKGLIPTLIFSVPRSLLSNIELPPTPSVPTTSVTVTSVTPLAKSNDPIKEVEDLPWMKNITLLDALYDVLLLTPVTNRIQFRETIPLQVMTQIIEMMPQIKDETKNESDEVIISNSLEGWNWDSKNSHRTLLCQSNKILKDEEDGHCHTGVGTQVFHKGLFKWKLKIDTDVTNVRVGIASEDISVDGAVEAAGHYCVWHSNGCILQSGKDKVEVDAYQKEDTLFFSLDTENGTLEFGLMERLVYKAVGLKKLRGCPWLAWSPSNNKLL